MHKIIFYLSFLFFLSIGCYGEAAPKKIMFIVHTESIGGKGVYEIYKEMKKVGHDVKIVAIPSFYNGERLADVDADFTKKFDENDVLYPCGKSAPYKKCEAIEKDKVDYVFIQNPYDTFAKSILDPHFLNSNIKKLAKKVMFIIYGPHLFHQDTINDPNLPNLVDTVFVDSESTKDIYIKKYKFPPSRVVVSGYQTYKSIRDGIKKKKNTKETILWLPRWYLSLRYKELFEGGSTFLNYYHFFYNYAKENQDINFIIRPHLLLFSRAVASQFLSQEDIDEIFNKFRSLKNVTISMHDTRSLVDDVLASDVVISDGTSALGEVVVADKPIIYLSNGWNNEFNSNPLSRELKNYIYLAYDPPDIINYLSVIRKNKYHPFLVNKTPNASSLRSMVKSAINYFNYTLSNRDSFKKRLDPVENPAKFIAEYLLLESS